MAILGRAAKNSLRGTPVIRYPSLAEQRRADVDPDLVPHLASKPNPSPTGFNVRQKIIFSKT